MVNITHAKPQRNADVAFRILVLGRAPVRVAEDENLSLPRVNQIVSMYAIRVLRVPREVASPIRVLKAFVEKYCIRNNELVPYER